MVRGIRCFRVQVTALADLFQQCGHVEEVPDLSELAAFKVIESELGNRHAPAGRLNSLESPQVGLSRLNRVAPGKDQTFVLDFANNAEDIVEAFEPYFEATTLADVTDPNIVHETMNKLDAADIYQESEID